MDAAAVDEDVDVTTGSVPGVTISGDSLSGWKEAPIPIRSRNSDLGTNAVWLGWNNKPVGKDTTKPRAPASYTISISDSLRGAWNIGEGSSVTELHPFDRRFRDKREVIIATPGR